MTVDAAAIEMPTASRDVIYRDGFPDGWFMCHRTDTTLLHRRGDLSPLGLADTIAAAPKLRQGKAWLETAQLIARAIHAVEQAEMTHLWAKFCDHCGIGPPVDEHGDEEPNTRAEESWICSGCGHSNARPVEKS